MKRKLWAVIFTAVLVLLISVQAQADLSRGDRGDDVAELQTLLIEGGWLEGEADGSFGARTQQAVRAFQSSLGVEETGVADDELIALLKAALSGEADAQPEAEPDRCIFVHDEYGVSVTLCARHAALDKQAQTLIALGTTEGLIMAEQLWADEVDRLLVERIRTAPAEERLSAMSAMTAWQVAEQTQRALLEATLDDSLLIEESMTAYLRERALELCAAS